MNELQMIYCLVLMTEMVAMYELLFGNIVFGVFLILFMVGMVQKLTGPRR